MIRIVLFSSAFYPQVLTVPTTVRYLKQTTNGFKQQIAGEVTSAAVHDMSHEHWPPIGDIVDCS